MAFTVSTTDQALAHGALLEQAPRELSFRLDEPHSGAIDWFMPFRDASIERLGPLRTYTQGRWGRWTESTSFELSWQPWLSSDIQGPPVPLLLPNVGTHAWSQSPGWFLGSPADSFAGPSSGSLAGYFDVWVTRTEQPLPGPLAFDFTGVGLASNGFEGLLKLPSLKPVVDWRCRRRPVVLVRHGGESERLLLVACDGQMENGALDGLSVLARPPEVERPGVLPDDPDPEAWAARREWVSGVRIVHPRLVWAVQRIADAFPGRAIYIYSGYRPSAEVNDGSGHRSLHAEGRALDISVMRVPNEKVFAACRELKDVGCGFYPHNKFIHLDVRRAQTGKAFWIDASEPGEKSHYVDGWPGVVETGALSFGADSSAKR